MKKRILTGVVLGVLFSFFLLTSHITWLCKLVITLLSVAGVTEMSKANGHKPVSFFNVLCCAAAVVICWQDRLLASPTSNGIFLFLAALLFALFIKWVRFIPRVYTVSVIFLNLQIPVFLKTAILLRSMSQGFLLLTCAILVAVLTDILAFSFGTHYGKHPLAAVSPKKTVEGAFGGLLSAPILLLIAVLLAEPLGITVNCVNLAWYLLMASIVGQFGDISYSSVKRINHIKDYGSILPGHGGVLDRFDSLLFVLPFTYVFTQLISIIHT